jgi:hypothetical protein
MNLQTAFAASFLLIAPSGLGAQAAPSAPVPTQIGSAHTLFLTNAGDVDNATNQRAYNAVYAALQKSNRFQLATAPEKADLLLELHCFNEALTEPGQNAMGRHRVRVDIIDPVSRRTLWTITEKGPDPAFTLNPGDAWGRNFNKVADKLTLDLDTLANGSQIQTPKRTRLSEGKK